MTSAPREDLFGDLLRIRVGESNMTATVKASGLMELFQKAMKYI